MKRNNIEPYEKCLCGSGKKFKFCCYKNKDLEFHNVNEACNYSKKNVPKLSFCIHADNDCDKEIINSHSIQNNKIISKLSVDNHTYIIDFSSQTGFLGNDFKIISRNKATTSKSFCSYHDNKIFKPIECSDYLNNEEQNFLFAYRAFSKHYFDNQRSLKEQQVIFKARPKAYISNSGMVTHLKGLYIEKEKHENLRLKFNSALDSKNFSFIKTYVIELNYEIQFATAYMAPLSYDLKGNQVSDLYSLIDDMKYIFVTMFPENGKSYILISWLFEDNEYLKEFINQVDMIKKDKSKLFNVLNNLLASQSDNFVISPNMLESWDESQKKNFLAIFTATFVGIGDIRNIGQEIEKNLERSPCKFNLFQ